MNWCLGIVDSLSSRFTQVSKLGLTGAVSEPLNMEVQGDAQIQRISGAVDFDKEAEHTAHSSRGSSEVTVPSKVLADGLASVSAHTCAVSTFNRHLRAGPSPQICAASQAHAVQTATSEANDRTEIPGSLWMIGAQPT
jgi:hypothetical protein